MSLRSTVVLVVLLAACNKAKSASPGAAGGFAMPVEVSPAIRDTVVDAIAATGQIEAVQSIELRPEVQGRITEILVREGEEVEEGTALFKVDDDELKAQVDVAIYDLLKTRLDRTVVRAPFACVVGRRLVSIGTFVSNQTPLTSLQSVNPQHASFQVPERYADRLRKGQLVSFQVAALPGKNFSGEVVFVDPVVEVPARTILIKARVPNPEHRLQAGMFLEARLATDIRPNAVVVPEDALLPMQGATFVWVVKDGKANQRQVTVGVRTAG